MEKFLVSVLLLAVNAFLLVYPSTSFVVTNERSGCWFPAAPRGCPSSSRGRSATVEDNESPAPIFPNDENDLRFSGVGRLFTTTPPPSSAASEENHPGGAPEEPQPREDHLRVVDRMQRSRVVVVGLGGVGSWAAEALCRSGVGHITLIDLDDICISNTNRQLHALSTSVGQMKIDAMKARLEEINPSVEVTLVHDFVSKENADDVWETIRELSPVPVTACLDAIDGSDAKTAWIASCARRRVPIVTCGGSAGRTDPTKFTCDDLTRAVEDNLLSSCRKNLRKYYGFQEGVSPGAKARDPKTGKLRKKLPRKWKIQAVYSTEAPRQLPRGSGTSSLRRCDGALGTACFVTGASGFVAAGKIVEMIASDNLPVPKQFSGNQLREKTWGR
ncbi:unnamed protein product [Pseudo-nitzschia multistriata]|uniref:THIF-type NAD/FAD binding fold domain-containing protein n=1 Tax=Pseudo-nitzschia multistriata TaxID=183589 RepID=A0A448YZP5_9STRA|nr:unnamed protein product [Pseudo-nitzschia multistriata]